MKLKSYSPICDYTQVLKVETDSLVPANPDILDGVDDLMQLSYLNEPSVLYNLQYRYDRNMIYVSSLDIDCFLFGSRVYCILTNVILVPLE